MLKTRLNKLARESINGLIAKNIPLTPDQIVIIHELSKKASSISLDPRLLLMASKKVGNINIYPLTIGAKIWIRIVLTEFFQDDDMMVGLAILYAHSHAREPEKLNFDDASKCREDIIEWAKTNNLTEKEFDTVIESFSNVSSKGMILDYLTGLVEQIKNNPSNINLISIYDFLNKLEFEELNSDDSIPALAILLKYFGADKEHWLWGESEDVCMGLIKQALEMESGKKSSQLDPSLIAFKELQGFINSLKNK